MIHELTPHDAEPHDAGLDSLDLFLNEIGRTPLLNKEQEVELASASRPVTSAPRTT